MYFPFSLSPSLHVSSDTTCRHNVSSDYDLITGTQVEKWKKRWFELKPNGLLVYYDKREPSKRKMKVHVVYLTRHRLSSCPIECTVEHDVLKSRIWIEAHKLKNRGRYDLTLQVVTSTMAELERWTNVFRAVSMFITLHPIGSSSHESGATTRYELRVHGAALINRTACTHDAYYLFGYASCRNQRY